MKKKLVSLLTALSITLMLFMCMPISVSADVVDSGSCGADGNEDNVTWSLDSNGVLTISGSGDMKDFDSWNKAPWIAGSDTVATALQRTFMILREQMPILYMITLL